MGNVRARIRSSIRGLMTGKLMLRSQIVLINFD